MLYKLTVIFFIIAAFSTGCIFAQQTSSMRALKKIKYNNPDLKVDLEVGLWGNPFPMDYDGDGDVDLLVSSSNRASNGIFFFENTGGDGKMPTFKPGVRLGKGYSNIQVSYTDRKPRLLIPGRELMHFKKTKFKKLVKIYSKENVNQSHVRANQWKYVDYNGDGVYDLIVGVGDWRDYGISEKVRQRKRKDPYNKDWTIFSNTKYNKRGIWEGGPVHGYVYLLKNKGTNDRPDYKEPIKIQAGGTPLDVYGRPSPNFADFDGDGDLDIICGEFLDKLTYFENIGTRDKPIYAKARHLSYNNAPIKMDLEMIAPIAYDWDKDGDVDLIVGQEDGRVAFIENTGHSVNGIPEFLPPKNFKQEAKYVKFGVLSTPYSVDWDGDGDEDLIVGNSAGYIGFIENLGGYPPKWAAPKRLKENGKIIRIQAGYSRDVKGPSEAKWGYTVPTVADWNNDGLLDIVINTVWGKVLWYRNKGPKRNPKLAEAQPIQIRNHGMGKKPAWNWWDPVGNNFVTQWRTTPFTIDLTGDGLVDLVVMDSDGYLTLYKNQIRNKRPYILGGKHIFKQEKGRVYDSRHRVQKGKSDILRLNSHTVGGSGRVKFCMIDWNLDGHLDLLVNSNNIDFMKNVSTKDGEFIFEDQGPVAKKRLAGHTTCPTTVDWNKDGIPDLLIGAEDGFFYYKENPNTIK